jgi:hypothetical protein
MLFPIPFAEARLMSEMLKSAGTARWLAQLQIRLRNWLRHRLGIDNAIAFTVLARGWGSLAGLVTVVLIARFLTRAQQGYYYTFGSLIALQIVFELGFSFVILQMASHERAHLTFSPDGQISGDAVAHSRLASVLQETIRWYTVAAVLMAAFLLIAGSYFFSAHQTPGEVVAWRIPWYSAVFAAALTPLVIGLVMRLPVGTYTFLKYRRAWHEN